MTPKHIALADDIVNNFKLRNGVTTYIPSIVSLLQPKGYDIPEIYYVVKMLEHKGILSSQGLPADNTLLTDKGWVYESYGDLLKSEERKTDLESAVLQSTLNANKSIKQVNTLFWATAFFAFFSAIGTIGSFILQLKTELRMPSQKIPSLQKDIKVQSKKPVSVLNTFLVN